jgi:hypothetical protein
LTNRAAIFKRGQVVAILRPSTVKLATVVTDTTVKDDAWDAPESVVSVLYYEEIHPVNFGPSSADPDAPMGGRDVHFLAHASGKPSQVAVSKLLRKDDRAQIIEWQNGDIWDQLRNGTFRGVDVADYASRERLPGDARGTIFLIERVLYAEIRKLGGRETRQVKKRSLMWDVTPLDGPAARKSKS